MRVLLLMASGARGGGADHLWALAHGLRNLAVEVLVAVDKDGPLGDRLRAAGFEVEPIALMHSRVDPRGVRAVVDILRKHQPDVVHLHGTRAGLYGAAARALAPAGKRWVYTAHGLAFRKEAPLGWRLLAGASEALVCRAVDRVISVSRHDLEELVARRFVARTAGSHIPNAVDLGRFTDVPPAPLRRTLGIPEAQALVGVVARLVPQKGLGDLVRAMQGVEQAALVLAGDGTLRAELEALAKGLGVSAHFLGARDDVPALLAAFDLFVLPSRWEGEPIALLEALAAGKACVATATGGAHELLENGAGRLVPVGDVAALRAAVLALLASPAERQRLGQAARAALAGRDSATVAQRTLEVYRG